MMTPKSITRPFYGTIGDMTNSDTPELIRASAAAARLGINTRTLQRWSDSGTLPPPVRIGPGQRRFYRRADIDALLHNEGAQ